MALMGFRAEDRCEAAVLEILDALGVSLTIGTDFRQFEQYVNEARPDHPLGDPFKPDLPHLTPDKACWIVGRDRDGKIMHLHALRVLPTEGKSVAEYFRKNFLNFSPPELAIDAGRSRYRACPAAKRMTGTVVYAGEFWVGMPPSQYRGVDLVGRLVQYAMIISLRRLQSQHFIGFVAKPQAIKGLALRFGFMHADPFALRWYSPNKPDPLEGVMIYMSDEDMRYSMDMPSNELEALAA